MCGIVGLGKSDVAGQLAARLRADAGEFLSAMEFFSDLGLDMALAYIPGLAFPLATRAPIYALIELGSGSPQVPLEAILSEVMEWGIEEGIVRDGAMAMSQTQRAALWRLREEQPEGQRREGAQLKHDISVPPGRLAEFLDRATDTCETILAGVRVNPFGHLGDGNVHFNLSPPPGQTDFSGRDFDFAIELGGLATEMGGVLPPNTDWAGPRLPSPTRCAIRWNGG